VSSLQTATLLLLLLLSVLCSLTRMVCINCTLLLLLVLLLVGPWHQALHQRFVLEVGPVNIEHPAIRLQVTRASKPVSRA
jgi:hypothetical protein